MKKVLLSLITFFGLGLATNAQISSYPYTQDFESYTTCATGCGASCLLPGNPNDFFNAAGDNLDWLTDINGTSSTDTGPTANGGADHNPGVAGGKYLYVETSCSGTGYPNMTANLWSPQFDLNGTNSIQMRFWLHHFGSTQGVTHVDVSNDFGSTWTLDVIPATSGDQGDVWLERNVDLTAWTGDTVIVRIRHISGSSFSSDVAVDDFTVYDLLPNDAGIAGFVNPQIPTCAFNDSVEVTLTNAGTDTLVSANIDWEWNMVGQTTYNWSGSLAPGVSETVFLGTVAYTNGDQLKAWSSLPNGAPEMSSGAGNDTTEIPVIQAGLNGTYTIGGVTPDYVTFQDAVNALNLYGVCGDVIFDVRDGVYNEQITLNEVIGAGPNATITFHSESGNISLVTLTQAIAASATNYTVNFDGADYFHFEDMTISNTGATYRRVLNFSGGSTFNSISDCRILGNDSPSTTSTNEAVIYSGPGGSLDHNNSFMNNIIEGGSYGIYWYGDGTASLEQGSVWSGNHFLNNYYYGARLYYQDAIQFTNNRFTTNSSYTGTMWGYYFYYCDNGTSVTGNSIEGFGTHTGTEYGIYMVNCDGTAQEKVTVANNMISVGITGTSTNTLYGIYSSNNGHMNYYNNSIRIDGAGTNNRGIYVTGGGLQESMNNNIQIFGSGGYGMYYNSTFTVVESDHNNVHPGNGNWGYFNANQATLGDFQSATGMDVNSISVDPQFVSDIDLHTCADSLDAAGAHVSSVTDDYDGQARDMSTPDIGADEFLGLANFGFQSDSLWKCSGDALVLGGWEPTDDATYLWSTTETTPTISVTNPGSYDVLATTGCGTVQSSVVVVDYTDAVASYTWSSSFLTAIFTNTSTGNISAYDWDFGDGNSSIDMSPSHVYSNTGTYYVTLTVTDQCGIHTYGDSVSFGVGISEILAGGNLDLYPNPNNGVFTLSFETLSATDVMVEVTDVLGKPVYTGEPVNIVGAHEQEITLKNAQSGVYFVRVHAGGETLVKRVVLK